MRKNFRRKGISLIEILIVVLLIILLSAGMVMSVTKASVSAEARNVINNLQILKAAVAMWYQDNIYRLDNDYTRDNGKKKDWGSHIKIWNKDTKKDEIQQVQNWKGEQLGIYKYLDTPEKFIINAHNPPSQGEYGITAALVNRDTPDANRWTWFVGYCFPNNFDPDVKEKIRELVKDDDDFHFNNTYAEYPPLETGSRLWLRVFKRK